MQNYGFPVVNAELGNVNEAFRLIQKKETC